MSATSAAVEQTTMTPEEKARADAIMKGWFAFNDYARSLEDALDSKVAEIGRKVADLVAKEIGVDENLIEDRDAEFGRVIDNTIRTFQMKLPYYHQGNDALIKEQLKWIDYAFTTNQVEKMISHDVDSMREILSERVYWIEQTDDISLALDAVTTPTCFRDWVVAKGFEWHDNRHRVSFVSSYQRILEKGWKRNIWTRLTEQKIYEEWFIPRFEGYAGHLQVKFNFSPWKDETKLIEISVAALS